MYTQICLPALHITLGVFYRLFQLLERDCHDLDIKKAVLQSSTPTHQSYAMYSAAAQRVHSIVDELEQRERQAKALDEIISYLNINSNNTGILKALQCQVADTRKRIKDLVGELSLLTICILWSVHCTGD